jgi:hypothetical protein
MNTDGNDCGNRLMDDGKNLSRVASYQSDIYGVRIIEFVGIGSKNE